MQSVLRAAHGHRKLPLIRPWLEEHLLGGEEVSSNKPIYLCSEESNLEKARVPFTNYEAGDPKGAPRAHSTTLRRALQLSRVPSGHENIRSSLIGRETDNLVRRFRLKTL